MAVAVARLRVEIEVEVASGDYESLRDWNAQVGLEVARNLFERRKFDYSRQLPCGRVCDGVKVLFVAVKDNEEGGA